MNVKKLNGRYLQTSMSDYDWKMVVQFPNEQHYPKTTPDKFEKLLNSIIKKLQSNNLKVVLTTIPPIDSKRYFENVIKKVADGSMVLKFLNHDIQNICRHQELYILIISKCAIKNNCILLDIRQNFLWDINYLSKFCDDGIHPNQQGQNDIANYVVSQLRNIGINKKLFCGNIKM